MKYTNDTPLYTHDSKIASDYQYITTAIYYIYNAIPKSHNIGCRNTSDTVFVFSVYTSLTHCNTYTLHLYSDTRLYLEMGDDYDECVKFAPYILSIFKEDFDIITHKEQKSRRIDGPREYYELILKKMSDDEIDYCKKYLEYSDV